MADKYRDWLSALAGRVLTSGLAIVAMFAACAWAGALPLSVVSITSPVRPFTDAAIHVKTAPAAHCDITVLYKSGPSRAKGLVPKQSNATGNVGWQWRVGSNTTPGRWPVRVSCEKGPDAAEIETSIEVRH
jgi:micrococcal nuclease